jgi:hypothetical protein
LGPLTTSNHVGIVKLIKRQMYATHPAPT